MKIRVINIGEDPEDPSISLILVQDGDNLYIVGLGSKILKVRSIEQILELAKECLKTEKLNYAITEPEVEDLTQT